MKKVYPRRHLLLPYSFPLHTRITLCSPRHISYASFSTAASTGMRRESLFFSRVVRICFLPTLLSLLFPQRLKTSRPRSWRICHPSLKTRLVLRCANFQVHVVGTYWQVLARRILVELGERIQIPWNATTTTPVHLHDLRVFIWIHHCWRGIFACCPCRVPRSRIDRCLGICLNSQRVKLLSVTCS